MNTNYSQATWRKAYAELINAMAAAGIPEEVGRYIAQQLGTERSMRRMISYMRNAQPSTMEEVADEMIAIIEDRNSWIQKKEAQQASEKYNTWLNSDMRGADE